MGLREDRTLCHLSSIDGLMASGAESVEVLPYRGSWITAATTGCEARDRSGKCERARQVAAQSSCLLYAPKP